MHLHEHTERMSTLQTANTLVGQRVSTLGNQTEQDTAPTRDLSRDVTVNILRCFWFKNWLLPLTLWWPPLHLNQSLNSSSPYFHPGLAPTLYVLILPLTHTFILPVASIPFTPLQVCCICYFGLCYSKYFQRENWFFMLSVRNFTVLYL